MHFTSMGEKELVDFLRQNTRQGRRGPVPERPRGRTSLTEISAAIPVLLLVAAVGYVLLVGALENKKEIPPQPQNNNAGGKTPIHGTGGIDVDPGKVERDRIERLQARQNTLGNRWMRDKHNVRILEELLDVSRELGDGSVVRDAERALRLLREKRRG